MWWNNFYVRNLNRLSIFILKEKRNTNNIYSTWASFIYTIVSSFFSFFMHFRWNFRMWTNIWTDFFGCDIWFECPIFYSRMEKWFFGSGCFYFNNFTTLSVAKKKKLCFFYVVIHSIHILIKTSLDGNKPHQLFFIIELFQWSAKLSWFDLFLL